MSYQQLSQQEVSRNRSERLQALQQARNNLIAYAVLYADNYPASGAGPGHFPCPDLDPPDDGIETNDGPNPPCSGAEQRLGRMPRFTYSRDSQTTSEGERRHRKRLEFYPPRSLMDEQLWYLVSSAFVNNPVGRVVNPSTLGTLSTPDSEKAIAIIFSPGRALKHQQQRPSLHFNDYLESVLLNATDTELYAVQHRGNDLLVTIRPSDIHEALLKRVSGYVSDWFEQYSQRVCASSTGRCYPFAAVDSACQTDLMTGTLPMLKGSCEAALTIEHQLDGVPFDRHWFLRNRWSDFVRYTISPECIDGALACQLKVETVNPARVGAVTLNAVKQRLTLHDQVPALMAESAYLRVSVMPLSMVSVGTRDNNGVAGI